MNDLKITKFMGKSYDLSTIRSHYNKIILFEMVKIIKDKELSLVGEQVPVRNIKAFYFDILYSVMLKYSFFDRYYNMYMSLLNYYNMPVFSYNPQQRKIQSKEFNDKSRLAIRLLRDYFIVEEGFDKPYKVDFIGYTVVLDFDEKCKYLKRKDKMDYCENQKKYVIDLKSYGECKYRNHGECTCFETNFYKMLSQLNECVDIFDTYDIHYAIVFSGSGFHLYIHKDQLKGNCHALMDFANRLSYELNDLFNFDTIDRGLYDYRRIWKVPYSIDIKTGNIALPLSKEELKDFDLDMVKPEIVNKLNIRDRGIIYNNMDKESKIYDFYDKYIKEEVL